MKMKATALLTAIVLALASVVSLSVAALLALAVSAAFGVYGVIGSSRRGLDPMNDVPNAFRVLLASVGGALLPQGTNFLIPSAGVLMVLASVFLNDEFQRLAVRSLLTGRRGGSVAFLGIDGSGKSRHAEATRSWLESRGYRCKLVPFHRYLFVSRLSKAGSPGRGAVGVGRRNPLRPLLSFFDNLLMLLLTSFGSGIEGTVVLYDRFIWSTYVKYEGLGYPVRPLSFLYLLPRPKAGLFFDITVDRSLEVIDERKVHIRYPRDVLSSERDFYLRIAKSRGYPVIDSTASFEAVQGNVEAELSAVFPATKGGSS